MARRARLREAFTNLIFNAVDALPNGGTIFLGQRAESDAAPTPTTQRPSLKYATRALASRASSSRSSSTRSLPPRANAARALDLPQVLAIVERHGGRIELTRAIGQGTTFRMRFPIVTEQTTIVGDVSEAPATVNGSRSIRVLVVEDEEQLARMAESGPEPARAPGDRGALGRAGLRRAEREQSFDLVISDLGLGAGKNGWDVADEVRSRHPGTRFVLVTGWGAGIDPKEARLRGVDEVIPKPYRIADLRQVADFVAGGPESSDAIR